MKHILKQPLLTKEVADLAICLAIKGPSVWGPSALYLASLVFGFLFPKPSKPKIGKIVVGIIQRAVNRGKTT